MVRKLSRRTFRIVAGTAIALVVAWFAMTRLGGYAWLQRTRAITDIKLNRKTTEARQKLLDSNDRRAALDAVKGALEEEGDTVQAKINLLQTLGPRWFNQPRVIQRAIDSEVPETRRAAAWLLYTDEDLEDRCREIALAWLRDAQADSRDKAVLLCRRMKVEEAVPVLLKVLETEPEDQPGLELLRQSLAALREFKPTGLADRLVAMAENGGLPESVRAEALDTVSTLDDAPRDRIQAMAIRTLKDKDNSVFMRGKTTTVLKRKRYGDEKAWEALESVLLDSEETEPHHVTQRLCLSALGARAPLDRVRKLLLDRRIYNHPYYAIHVDVCTGLTALNVRERVALDILTKYLMADDPRDVQNQVRREAWLSLWTLTGVMYGVKDKTLFRRPPAAIEDPRIAREYLFRHSHSRPGVTLQQIKALDEVTADLARMREIQETYGSPRVVQDTLDRWREAEEAKKAREAGKDEDEPKGPQPPVGPQIPKDDEEKVEPVGPKLPGDGAEKAPRKDEEEKSEPDGPKGPKGNGGATGPDGPRAFARAIDDIRRGRNAADARRDVGRRGRPPRRARGRAGRARRGRRHGPGEDQSAANARAALVQPAARHPAGDRLRGGRDAPRGRVAALRGSEAPRAMRRNRARLAPRRECGFADEGNPALPPDGGGGGSAGPDEGAREGAGGQAGPRVPAAGDRGAAGLQAPRAR